MERENSVKDVKYFIKLNKSMKSPQQKLAEKLYELLPHKKELEFGCEIQTHFDGVQTITHRHKIGNVKECWGTTTGTYGSLCNDEDIKEIIGQPLRLADLLMALSQVGEVTRGGKYLINIVADGNSFIDYRWSLSKDNILDQSDELCEFCLGLLDKE